MRNLNLDGLYTRAIHAWIEFPRPECVHQGCERRFDLSNREIKSAQAKGKGPQDEIRPRMVNIMA